MSRVYNFSAGPSMLPLPVLEKAASEMTDYRGSGMSVMEMSHRTPVYEEIIHTAEANLRKLMSIPDNYKVLFLQGGATTQFSAVPLNLMNKNRKADYIVSGQFSKKAADEAARYGEVTVLASSKDRNFTYVPYVDSFSPDADYVHICHNNTIFGTTYNYVPATGDIPLVADMSSSIISCPVNVRDYALIYAGAQKNIRRRRTTSRCITRRPATPSISPVWSTSGRCPSADWRRWRSATAKRPPSSTIIWTARRSSSPLRRRLSAR